MIKIVVIIKIKKKYIYSRKLNAKHLKKTKLIYTINNIYSYNNKKKIILI